MIHSLSLVSWYTCLLSWMFKDVNCIREGTVRESGRETGHEEGNGSTELLVAAAERAVHHQAEHRAVFGVT